MQQLIHDNNKSPVNIKRGKPYLPIGVDKTPLLYENENCLYYKQTSKKYKKRNLCELKYYLGGLNRCENDTCYCKKYVPGIIPVYKISGTCDNKNVILYRAIENNAKTVFNTLNQQYDCSLKITRTRISYEAAKEVCMDLSSFLEYNNNKLYKEDNDE